MSKKMMLLALSVMSAALFALPAVASATTAHISVAEKFTVSKGTAVETVTLETHAGEKVECHKGVSGSGSFSSTTAGTLSLEFHECTTANPFGGAPLVCTSSAAQGGTGIPGTISTTVLPFDLITIAGPTPGVLVTSAAGGHFASFTCGGIVTRKVTGNGVIGTITAPSCGAASLTATLKFDEGVGTTGIQKHTTYTGVKYGLFSNETQAAQTAEGVITFAKSKTITCT